MHRNDLITHLSRTDNDTVAVDINDVLVEVEGVKTDRGMVVIVLNQEDLLSTLIAIAGRPYAYPTSDRVT